jgi:hypothetical protein
MRRLRDPAFGTETSERNLMNQAADRIAQLEAALRDIKQYSLELYATGVARAALEERT